MAHSYVCVCVCPSALTGLGTGIGTLVPMAALTRVGFQGAHLPMLVLSLASLAECLGLGSLAATLAAGGRGTAPTYLGPRAHVCARVLISVYRRLDPRGVAVAYQAHKGRLAIDTVDLGQHLGL